MKNVLPRFLRSLQEFLFPSIVTATATIIGTRITKRLKHCNVCMWIDPKDMPDAHCLIVKVSDVRVPPFDVEVSPHVYESAVLSTEVNVRYRASGLCREIVYAELVY